MSFLVNNRRESQLLSPFVTFYCYSLVAKVKKEEAGAFLVECYAILGIAASVHHGTLPSMAVP